MDEVKRILEELRDDVKTAPDNALMRDWKPGIVRDVKRVLVLLERIEKS